jgi:hypothetical protein
LVGGRSVDRGQYEQSTIGIAEEAGDDQRTRSEEVGCHARWRVTNSQPDRFRRVAKEKGELPEVAGRFGMVSVMKALQEGYRAGIDYLEAVTALLHRVRCADPMAGLYEAAEVQWWWAQRSRSTDRFDQLFWYDDAGRPAAAVIATEFGDQTQLDPIVMPDESPEWTAQ